MLRARDVSPARCLSVAPLLCVLVALGHWRQALPWCGQSLPHRWGRRDAAHDRDGGWRLQGRFFAPPRWGVAVGVAGSGHVRALRHPAPATASPGCVPSRRAGTGGGEERGRWGTVFSPRPHFYVYSGGRRAATSRRQAPSLLTPSDILLVFFYQHVTCLKNSYESNIRATPLRQHFAFILTMYNGVSLVTPT